MANAKVTEHGRFIPACAGNSLRQASNAFGHDNVGSSPRVRGTVDASGINVGVNRFIPACAGNSRGQHATTVRHTVHPRVCGEQQSKR